MNVIAVQRSNTQADASSIWRLVSKRAASIVVLNDNGIGLPFYCVHSIAGDIDGYHDLARLLGPDQRFYGIQIPKADMVPARAENVEAIARRHVAALTGFQPEGPLAIGGFSAGAIVALEMAVLLRAAGREVPLLVALDGAPNNTGATLDHSDPRYLWQLARNLPRWLMSEELRDWSPRNIASRLFNRFVFRPGPGLPPAPTAHLDAVMEVLDRPEWQSGQRLFIGAMFNAICAYQPTPYEGRVLVYETRAQPLFHLMQVGTVWRALASRAEIVPLPGKHQSFFRDTTTIGPLSEHLRERLRTAGEP